MKQMEVNPIPVVIQKSDEELTALAVEFGVGSTWPVPNLATSVPVQILTRRPTRKKARILVPVPSATANGFTGQAVSATGVSGVAPAANTIIASISAASLLAAAPIGTTWTIQVTYSLQGTIAAGDANNMEVVMPIGTVRQVGIFPGVVGNYPQPTFTVTPAAGNNISVTNPNNATAAAVYGATITATPNGSANSGVTGVVLGHRPDYVQNGQGLVLPASILPLNLEWESQMPCFAGCQGGVSTVFTLDQSQAAIGAPAEEETEFDDLPYEAESESSGRWDSGSTGNRY